MAIIKSYLLTPRPGTSPAELAGIHDLPGCELQAAENGPLLILLTETENEADDRQLQDQLAVHPAIASLGLVSAFQEDGLPGEVHG